MAGMFLQLMNTLVIPGTNISCRSRSDLRRRKNREVEKEDILSTTDNYLYKVYKIQHLIFKSSCRASVAGHHFI